MGLSLGWDRGGRRLRVLLEALLRVRLFGWLGEAQDLGVGNRLAKG